jgi:hypothetical protein
MEIKILLNSTFNIDGSQLFISAEPPARSKIGSPKIVLLYNIRQHASCTNAKYIV